MVNLEPGEHGTLSVVSQWGWGWGWGGGSLQAGVHHVMHKHHCEGEGNGWRICFVYHSESLCFYFDMLRPTVCVYVCVHVCMSYFRGGLCVGGAGGLLETREQKAKVSVPGCGRMCFSCTCHAALYITLMGLCLSGLLQPSLTPPFLKICLGCGLYYRLHFLLPYDIQSFSHKSQLEQRQD